MKAYRTLEAANAGAAREAKRREAEAAQAEVEGAYGAWKSDRTGEDGVVRFDPRTDPHPPLPLWQTSWMPDEVAVALRQPGVKPDALKLFTGDLTLDEVERYAPMGTTDPAAVRVIVDDELPDEYAKAVLS